MGSRQDRRADRQPSPTPSRARSASTRSSPARTNARRRRWPGAWRRSPARMTSPVWPTRCPMEISSSRPPSRRRRRRSAWPSVRSGSTTRAPAAPVLVRGRLRVDDFWHAEGIIAPVDALTDAASGLGMLLLPGDADGRVRRVPLVAVVGDRLWPSLAVEIVRNYGGASALLLSADTGRLEIAGRTVPIGSNGMLRLLPLRHDLWADRTVSALDVLDAPEARQRLAGRIVLIGSSAPELGRTARGGVRPARPVGHAACGSGRADPQRHGADPRTRRSRSWRWWLRSGACVLATWLAHVLSPLMGSLVAAALAIAVGSWAPRFCCGGSSCSSIRSSSPRSSSPASRRRAS